MVGSNFGNVSLVIWTKSAPNKTQAKNAFKIVVWNTSKHGGRWCFQTFVWLMTDDIHSFYFVLFLTLIWVFSCQLREKLTWNILQVHYSLLEVPIYGVMKPLYPEGPEGFWGQSADVFCDLKTPSLVLQGSLNYQFWGESNNANIW